MSAPDDRTLAGYVLRTFGERAEDGSAFPEPGSFYHSLVQAVFRADALNRALLGLGFPTLVEMVDCGKTVEGGLARLHDVASGSRTWDEARHR